jgi:hypothetical protein
MNGYKKVGALFEEKSKTVELLFDELASDNVA